MKNYYLRPSLAFVFLISFVFILSHSASAQSLVEEKQNVRNPELPAAETVESINWRLKDNIGNPAAQEDYSWVSPQINSLLIRNVEFYSNDIVFASGELGTLLRSDDGGENWVQIQIPFGNHISSLQALSEESLWIAGTNGFVAFTSDGGMSWEKKETELSTNIRSLYVANEEVLYISGDNKMVARSTDSGENWETIDIPDEAIHNPNDRTNWSFNSVIVNNDNVFLALDGTGMPWQVIQSQDGGETWTSNIVQGLPTPGANIGVGITDLAFNDDFSVAYGSFRSGLAGGVIRSTDGGESWHRVENVGEFDPLPAPDVPYSTQRVQIMQAVSLSADGEKIIVAGLFGQVLASVDGGSKWKEVYGGVRQGDRDFYAVAFRGIDIAPDNEAWLVGGSRGIIAGAADFTPAQAYVRNGAEKIKTFMDIDFVDDQRGFAVGFETVQKFLDEDGAVGTYAVAIFYATEDGGETWTRQTGPGKDSYRWYSLQTGNDGQIWVSGMRFAGEEIVGIISYSNDYGQTWTEIYQLPPVSEIAKIKRFDDNHLYAATFGDTFLYTHNGEDWNHKTLPAPVSEENGLNSIETTAPKVVYVSGGHIFSGGQAYIMKTTDGGTTWETVFDSGSDAGQISNIHFVDARFGFASGLFGRFMSRNSLVYTNDYGNTWTTVEGTFDGANSAELGVIMMRDSINARMYGANGHAVVAEGTNDFSPLVPKFTTAHITGGHFRSANEYFVCGPLSSILVFTAEEHINTAPGKFTNTTPGWNETLAVVEHQDQVIEWTPSVDPDGDAVTYELIIENAEGTEEMLRISTEKNTSFAPTTQDFSDIPEGQYRWRVEATDEHGLYSSSFPTPIYIKYTDDEPSAYTVTFVITDTEENTIDDATIEFDGTEYDPGIYVFENIEPGTYNYTASREGYYPVEDQVVVDNDDVVVNVELTEEDVVETFTVVFNVDMTDSEQFDPETHEVYITGAFGEDMHWNEPGTNPELVLEQTEEPKVYTITLNLEAGNVEYKYASNAYGDGWDGAEWEGDPNREITVEDDKTIYDTFGTHPDHVGLDPTAEEQKITVYPNPAHTNIYITAEELITDITMVDILGKTVFARTNITANEQKINVSEFKKGIYFVRILTNAGLSIHKVQIIN